MNGRSSSRCGLKRAGGWCDPVPARPLANTPGRNGPKPGISGPESRRRRHFTVNEAEKQQLFRQSGASSKLKQGGNAETTFRPFTGREFFYNPEKNDNPAAL